GLIWVGVLPVIGALSEEIRSLISDIGGHATLMRAPNDIRSTTPVFQPQNPGVAALSARIKQNFDPQGILNPVKILLPGL
ncbi:MAG: 2-hydroxy-acid oxidase, partial [SAR202 cluster bacterium]|nr:2-hydroxy-acid oxidase [SAR202 cluster bacterium]